MNQWPWPHCGYECNVRTTWKVGNTNGRRYTYSKNEYPIGFKAIMEDEVGFRYLGTCIGNMKIDTQRVEESQLPHILQVIEE